jgi:hypothetical protein
MYVVVNSVNFQTSKCVRFYLFCGALNIRNLELKLRTLVDINIVHI